MAVVTQGQVNKFKINLLFMFHFWCNKTKLLFGNKISCVDGFIRIKINFIPIIANEKMKRSGVMSRFPRYASVNNAKDTKQNQ